MEHHASFQPPLLKPPLQQLLQLPLHRQAPPQLKPQLLALMQALMRLISTLMPAFKMLTVARTLSPTIMVHLVSTQILVHLMPSQTMTTQLSWLHTHQVLIMTISTTMIPSPVWLHHHLTWLLPVMDVLVLWVPEALTKKTLLSGPLCTLCGITTR